MTTERSHTQGSLLRDQLGCQKDETLDKVIPKYESYKNQMEFGAVWDRDRLSINERFICVLACLAIKRYPDKLKVKLGVALDSGLPARSISEVFMQVGLYGGLPVTEEAALITACVLDERGLSVDQESLPPENWETLELEAKAFKNALHGERSNTDHADPSNCSTNELYGIATNYGYGLVWRRPGLEIRQRLMVAIACFVSMGSLDSFFIKFCRSGMDHGISFEEIQEIVIQLSPYIGFPLSLVALRKLGQEIQDT